MKGQYISHQSSFAPSIPVDSYALTFRRNNSRLSISTSALRSLSLQEGLDTGRSLTPTVPTLSYVGVSSVVLQKVFLRCRFLDELFVHAPELSDLSVHEGKFLLPAFHLVLFLGLHG